MTHLTRRGVLKTSLCGGAGLIALPSLVPSSLFAQTTPNQRLQVVQIGCGRMGREDMAGVMAHPLARVVGVCELDSKRAAAAQEAVVSFYKKKGESDVGVKAYHDYHEVLARPDVDAVVVSLPDHWHALVAIEAALAGKNIYVQKPITYSIAESIALRKAVRAKNVILQTGSQQRSEKPFPAFRPGSEAVRNGRIGQLKTVQIGIGLDNTKGKAPTPMPVPANLDYERWLGAAPEQPYMEDRVHPQTGLGRPGWITTEDFGLGMITNWGAHHIDIAQWAMGAELSGPTSIEAKADFMTNDVWTVHRHYHVEMLYPGGVRVILDDKFPNGIRFEGSEGWVFCTRGAVQVTTSDGNAKDQKANAGKSSLQASDPRILTPRVGSDQIGWQPSTNHYLNWLQAIVAKRDPIAPVDQAARSLQTCAAAWIGMKLGRKLTWDPAQEAFVGDDTANAMRSRKARKPEYDVSAVMKKAGLA